jgi:hypothetical protein
MKIGIKSRGTYQRRLKERGKDVDSEYMPNAI